MTWDTRHLGQRSVCHAVHLGSITQINFACSNGPPSEAVMGVIKEIEEQSKSQPIKVGQLRMLRG